MPLSTRLVVLVSVFVFVFVYVFLSVFVSVFLSVFVFMNFMQSTYLSLCQETLEIAYKFTFESHKCMRLSNNLTIYHLSLKVLDEIGIEVSGKVTKNIYLVKNASDKSFVFQEIELN